MTSAGPDTVPILPGLAISRADFDFVTSRSSGPGGQHVNKVETRVTLRFDLDASTALTEEQKETLRERLATRITKAGVLQVTASRHRSQSANRQLVEERFVELLRDGLRERPTRRPTKVPARARSRRLAVKKRRAEIKSLRSRPDSDD